MRLIDDEVNRPMGMGYSTFRRPGASHDIGDLLAVEDEYGDIRRHELVMPSAGEVATARAVLFVHRRGIA